MTESVNNEAEQMNKEEPANVEIVTKEPIPVNPAVAKIKDPKKIEAGKKLAAYNKKAKKSKAALKEKNINDNKPVDDETTNQGGPGFDITLTTVVAIIGLGLTGVNLYLTHKKNNEKGVKDYKMSIIDYKPVCNLNEKTPVDNGDEKNIKANKGVKKVRFEPGMA